MHVGHLQCHRFGLVAVAGSINSVFWDLVGIAGGINSTIYNSNDSLIGKKNADRRGICMR